MSDLVKVALIAAATVLIAVGVGIYFSPYHSCMREGATDEKSNVRLAISCAHGWMPS